MSIITIINAIMGGFNPEGYIKYVRDQQIIESLKAEAEESWKAKLKGEEL